jgi:manganese transport protein
MINFATADSMIALFLALFVNAAILITSSAAFHARGQKNVRHIEEASELMRKWMGPAASILFGLALLAAGQSSTVTGTIAGQIVFEGFLKIRLKPWLRRIVTRVVAIAPALLIVMIAGEDSINRLLLVSQVILTFQLPFAIIPLIIFTFNAPKTGIEGQSRELAAFWSGKKLDWKESLLKVTSWSITVFIIIMNLLLVYTMLNES